MNLWSLHSYMYRVYKAGTSEPPFTNLKDVIIETPEIEYGALIGFPDNSYGVKTIIKVV